MEWINGGGQAMPTCMTGGCSYTPCNYCGSNNSTCSFCNLNFSGGVSDCVINLCFAVK